MTTFRIISTYLLLLTTFGMSKAADNSLIFSKDEIAIIRSFGPWPQEMPKDTSNRFSKDPEAIAFGMKLFFDKDVSTPPGISCASCHNPELAFGDGVDRSFGLARIDRNSIALANLPLNRWFGWVGRSDNLWAQSIHPILDSREMGASAESLEAQLLNRPDLTANYLATTGNDLETEEPQIVLVNIAKILAAFQETIVTPRTSFDQFRDQLTFENQYSLNSFSETAKRGLKVFINDGNCFVCHFGPNFTNNEFSNNALPHFIDGGKVDGGRYDGIVKFQSEPYNKTGPFSDDKTINQNNLVDAVKLLPRNWGEFRVPTLRNITKTAPYMHDGSLPTLEDVIDHYSNINLERLHTDGENILKPLNLNEQQTDDLIAFLKTLDGNPDYYANHDK